MKHPRANWRWHAVAMIVASFALCAQSGDNPRSAADVRQIVGLSIAATWRHWQARRQYSYTERDDDRRLDSEGRIRSQDVEISRTILVNGVPFEQLLERNGCSPSPQQERKQQGDLDKLKRETAEQRADRLRKQEEDASIVLEVPKAFDFQLVGEDLVRGRPVYVLQATPHPGYKCSPRWRGGFGSISTNSDG